jgi:hypothetical protein
MDPPDQPSCPTILSLPVVGQLYKQVYPLELPCFNLPTGKNPSNLRYTLNGLYDKLLLKPSSIS